MMGSGVLGAHGRLIEADPYHLSASWPSTGCDSLHRTGAMPPVPAARGAVTHRRGLTHHAGHARALGLPDGRRSLSNQDLQHQPRLSSAQAIRVHSARS